ncbi:unnamed protein product [Diamesa hyperborea]
MSFRHESDDPNCKSGFFNTSRSFATKSSESYMKAKKDLNLLGDSNFLSSFNSENSKRDGKMKRQTYIKVQTKPKSAIDRTSMYDEFGLIRQTREDVCDCCDLTCGGCHFPCVNCGSQKCAIKCRVNRKIAYETIEKDEKDVMLEDHSLMSNTSYRTH